MWDPVYLIRRTENWIYNSTVSFQITMTICLATSELKRTGPSMTAPRFGQKRSITNSALSNSTVIPAQLDSSSSGNRLKFYRMIWLNFYRMFWLNFYRMFWLNFYIFLTGFLHIFQLNFYRIVDWIFTDIFDRSFTELFDWSFADGACFLTNFISLAQVLAAHNNLSAELWPKSPFIHWYNISKHSSMFQHDSFFFLAEIWTGFGSATRIASRPFAGIVRGKPWERLSRLSSQIRITYNTNLNLIARFM